MKWVLFLMVWISPSNQLPADVEAMRLLHATFNSSAECQAAAAASVQKATADGLLAAAAGDIILGVGSEPGEAPNGICYGKKRIYSSY